MLCTMRELLGDAQTHRYALPAFDVSNYEMMRAVLDTCEEERSPALLMGLGVDLEGRGMNLIASMAAEASKYYSIPICLHLDHATDFAELRRAAEAGFSSVMYDGSALPLEENIRNTAEAVRFAHGMGLTVEAELGHVGNALVGNERERNINEDPEDSLTDPEEVLRFCRETDVDALAVAIGTAHGVYQRTPSLRIDRLDAITAVCGRPLVLHGGSGTPADQLQSAIAHGITKINIYSDVVAALNSGLRAKLNTIENPAAWPVYVFEEARRNMREVIREKLRTFGSSGRV